MPDRAIPPLLAGAAAGFVCGIIAAVLQLTGVPVLLIALAGAALVLLSGAASTVGVEGAPGEKPVVGGLRGGLGVALFLCVYLAILSLLRDGNVLLCLLLLVAAGICGILLTRLRVRSPEALAATQGGRATGPDATSRRPAQPTG